jgi:hypothetical protein
MEFFYPFWQIMSSYEKYITSSVRCHIHIQQLLVKESEDIADE